MAFKTSAQPHQLQDFESFIIVCISAMKIIWVVSILWASGYAAEDMESFGNHPRYRRNALRSRGQAWPNGQIPYTMTPGVFNATEKAMIEKAFDVFHEKTCLRFKPRDAEPAYVKVFKGNECSASIGRTSFEEHALSLPDYCFLQFGVILHELMHLAGFEHEHVRPDRDDYVKISMENVLAGNEDLFRKKSYDAVSTMNAPYDYCSIMHYVRTVDSKNGEDTITPIKPTGGCNIGDGQIKGELSEIDILKINTLYSCQGLPQLRQPGELRTEESLNIPAVVKGR